MVSAAKYQPVRYERAYQLRAQVSPREFSSVGDDLVYNVIVANAAPSGRWIAFCPTEEKVCWMSPADWAPICR